PLKADKRDGPTLENEPVTMQAEDIVRRFREDPFVLAWRHKLEPSGRLIKPPKRMERIDRRLRHIRHSERDLDAFAAAHRAVEHCRRLVSVRGGHESHAAGGESP